MVMDIDFFFPLLFSACNVLNHFLCAIAQTRGPASRARGPKAGLGGAGRPPRGGAARTLGAEGGPGQAEQMVPETRLPFRAAFSIMESTLKMILSSLLKALMDDIYVREICSRLHRP